MITAQEKMNLKLKNEERIKRKREEAERRKWKDITLEQTQAWIEEAAAYIGYTLAHFKISEDAVEYLKSLGYRVFTCKYIYSDVDWLGKRFESEGMLTYVFWDTREEFVQHVTTNTSCANYTFFDIKEL